MLYSYADRSVGEKKPRISGDEGPSLTELSGYNSKRQEFEIEYDNDAEQLLADMEFKDTDSDAEREIKLRILRIYSKRYIAFIFFLNILFTSILLQRMVGVPLINVLRVGQGVCKHLLALLIIVLYVDPLVRYTITAPGVLSSWVI